MLSVFFPNICVKLWLDVIITRGFSITRAFEISKMGVCTCEKVNSQQTDQLTYLSD